MNDYKLTFFTLFILFLGVGLGIPTGITIDRAFESSILGGNVRSESTGIAIIDGDSLTIGTSSADHELEIYNTATGTFKMYGSNTCDIREIDNTLVYYKASTTSVSGWTASTSDICN